MKVALETLQVAFSERKVRILLDESAVSDDR